MTVSFTDNHADRALISEIADRAKDIYAKSGVRADKLGIVMDLSAAHVTCPLRLRDLADADDFNLMHDVGGINRHLDRATGRLTGCFLPRFAAPQPEEAAA